MILVRMIGHFIAGYYEFNHLQKAFKFTHNDLPSSNIMYNTTKKEYLYYCVNIILQNTDFWKNI